MKKILKSIEENMQPMLIEEVSTIDKEYNEKYKGIWQKMYDEAMKSNYADSDNLIPKAMKKRDEAIKKRASEEKNNPDATSPIQNAIIDFNNQYITILEEVQL